MRKLDHAVGTREISDTFTNVAQLPKKPKKHTSPITLRLTEEEREKLKRLSSGMSVSGYIRKCLFGKGVNRRKVRKPCSG